MSGPGIEPATPREAIKKFHISSFTKKKIIGEKRFFVGGQKSSSGLWSWTDGSSWSFEKFVSPGNKNGAGSVAIFVRSDGHWVGMSMTFEANGYLCQYTL